MEFHAAGALIIFDNGNLVGLFRKTGKDYYSLPFGKREKGESPKDTAKREVLEETGVTIKILKNAPFIRTLNNKVYITYLAKPKNIGKPSHPDEGIFTIGKPELLLYGKYSEYNSAMLNHFGIK